VYSQYLAKDALLTSSREEGLLPVPSEGFVGRGVSQPTVRCRVVGEGGGDFLPGLEN